MMNELAGRDLDAVNVTAHWQYVVRHYQFVRNVFNLSTAMLVSSVC